MRRVRSFFFIIIFVAHLRDVAKLVSKSGENIYTPLMSSEDMWSTGIIKMEQLGSKSESETMVLENINGSLELKTEAGAGEDKVLHVQIVCSIYTAIKYAR